MSRLLDFATFRLIAGSKSFRLSLHRCDHCRITPTSGAHDYWGMRFCSEKCMTAYRARLSAETRRKILQLDVDPNSFKVAG